MAGGLGAFSSLYMCLTIFFIGTFVYGAVQLAAYTPLYTPVECHQLPGELLPPTTGLAWINITSTMKRECWNPNPYSIFTSQRMPGRVFVKNGSDLQLVGKSRVLSAEFLGLRRGTGESSMEITLPVAEATPLLAKPLLQVIAELHVHQVARSRFFGVAISASEDKDEVCGFEVRMATRKVGPSKCANTLDELVIPDVDAERPGVEALHWNEEGLAQQEWKKNAIFGSILAISFLGAAASIAFAWRVRSPGKSKAMDCKFNSGAPQGSQDFA